jgi:hypothetical protein
VLLRLAAALLVSTQTGCAALTAVGAGVAGVKAVYDFTREASSGLGQAIITACHEWELAKAAADARRDLGAVPQDKAARLSIVEAYAAAACNPANPPPGDPLATAIWLGGLAVQVEILSGGKS